VLSTQEVLNIAKTAQAESSKKKTSKRPCERSIEEVIKEDDRELEVISSDSESDCVVVKVRK
jgi:hypothetical protein